MNGRFRRRLAAGEAMIGTMVTLEAPEIVETLSYLGFDWLFVDTEHAPLLPHAVQHIIQAARDTACIVRLSRSDEISIKRALDAGGDGIIVPQVNSAAHARLIVSYAKYAPMGTRGIGSTRANLYGLDFDRYLAEANDSTAIVVQAEHVDAVENIDEICAVDGVDAVFIGPYDLSASLNKPGRLHDREVRDAILRVRDACLAHDVKLGIYGATVEQVAPYVAEGYTLICCGTDVGMLAGAARAQLATLRSTVTAGGP